MNPIIKPEIKKLITEIFNKRIKEWDIKKSSIEATELKQRVLLWIDNFNEHEQPLALLIFEKIDFFSKKKASTAIKWIAESIKRALGSNFVDANIFSIGDTAGSSGSHFLYDLLHGLQLPTSRAPKSLSQDLIESDSPLIFIDDIIGSGNQAISFFNKNLKSRLNSKKTTIYAALVASDSGLKKIKEAHPNLTVLPFQVLTDSAKAFHENSHSFPDPGIREQLKKIAQKYGQLLYPHHELGFEDGQLLLSFEWNTPNNTIPIVWAGPNSESEFDKRWTPLFERHKVSQNKYPSPVAKKSNSSIPKKIASYYNALPFSSLHVDTLYVNPNHTLCWINSEWHVTQQPSEDFREAVKQCIAAEKLAILYGPYGSGKSFLAKYLEFHGILGEREYVISTSTHTLLQKIRRFPGSYVEEIFPEGCQGIIIDAIDVLLVDNEDHSEELKLIANLIKTGLEKGINALLTIRQSDALEHESPIVRELAKNLLDSGALQIPAIKIERFAKPQIEAWLKNFGGQLTTQKIKHAHKRLLKATENPLFLYILADASQEGEDNISTIYGIYESFIKSTISGRFQSEKSTLPQSNTWKYANRYRSLLEIIAKEIAQSTRIGKTKDIGSYRSQHQQIEHSELIQDQLLDPNTITYSISEEQLLSILPTELRSMTVEPPEVNKQTKIQILNNYFFIRHDDKIGFRDNNILFFLVAHQLFRAIDEIANDPYSPNAEKALLEIANIKAHPQAIEILIRKIKNKQLIDQNKNICEAIESLISDKRIIQLTPRSIDQLSSSTINRDMILSIILLQIKETSYSKVPYFISRLSWLTNAIKNQDNAYRLLVARFFRNLRLIDIEFRRINCDDFNFQASKFASAKFIQTKLFDTTFRGCEFSKTEFTLCDFGDKNSPIIFDGISCHEPGPLSFNFCVAGALNFKELSGKTHITFTNCQIGNLVFSSPSKSEKYSLEIVIVNSTIESISFDKIYIKTGSTITNSRIDKISNKGSGGKFYASKSSIPSLQKICTGTGNIDFRDTLDESDLD